MPYILVIDDDANIRATIREILEYEGHQVAETGDGHKSIDLVANTDYDLVLCDLRMDKIDGIDILKNIIKIKPDLPVVMISGYGTLEIAVKASKLGAFDFISKPLDLNRLLITIRNALDKKNLTDEAKSLKKKVYKTTDIIGESLSIKAIKATIDKIAPTEARVLITGPNGTGKELVAKWIHEKSVRSEQAFVAVNCAAIPDELIESELFGHEKGSFTSAMKQHVGKFEKANNGTLFLDEIGDMSLSAQAKVLRVLQENKIGRVGGDEEIKINVRVLSATNKDLQQAVNNGTFREDLYHRLSVIIIDVPPLSERSGDIKLIAENFIYNICKDYNIAVKSIDDKALNLLKSLPWPGNIRELHNVIERLIIMSPGNNITEQDVSKHANTFMHAVKSVDSNNFNAFKTFQEFKEHMEKEFIKHKLKKNMWNISKTAEEMDMQRSHLYNKIEKYKLSRTTSAGEK